jgi:hypothetical protein
MATAYCVAGQTEKWQHYIDEMKKLFIPAISREALGLPNFITGGINRPTPESVATSWYIIANQGVNPFDPPKSQLPTLPIKIYLPLIFKNNGTSDPCGI